MASHKKRKKVPVKGNMLRKLISSQNADLREENWGVRQRYSKESIQKPLPGQTIMNKYPKVKGKQKFNFDSMCGTGDWGKRSADQNRRKPTTDRKYKYTYKDGKKIIEPSYIHPKRLGPAPIQMDSVQYSVKLPAHSMTKVTKALKEKSSNRAWAWHKHAGNDPKAKYKMVMEEFKRGTLHSGSGHKVTNPRQAMAIARSVASKLKYKKQVKFKGAGKMKGTQFSPAKSFLKQLARS